MWNNVKEHSVIFITVSVFLGGFLYAIISTHNNTIALKYFEKEHKELQKLIEKHQCETKKQFSTIRKKLVLLLDKNDIQDLLSKLYRIQDLLNSKDIQHLLSIKYEQQNINNSSIRYAFEKQFGMTIRKRSIDEIIKDLESIEQTIEIEKKKSE